MNMRVRIAAVVVVAAVAGFAAWSRLAGGSDADGALVVYGNVDIRQVELGFRVPGRIQAMPLEEGDAVAVGQELARLDQRPYRDELAMAEAEVARARAQLSKLERGNRIEEIEQARAVVVEREAALANARTTRERLRSLVAEGAVSRQAVDDASAALDAAVARLDVARRSLELAEEGFRSEDIEAGRAALAQAQAHEAAARTGLEDTVIKAPSAGTVLARVREPGAIVAAGQTVYTVSLTHPVDVRAYVAEPELGHVHPGDAVRVHNDTDPARVYHGQIGFISPVAEFTPRTVETPELRTELVYRLRIVIEDADEGLRQGMPVTVRIPRTPHPE